MEITTKKRAKLFSGTSNRELAEEIAAHLGMRLDDVELDSFASGEMYVRFQDSVRGSDAFVIQTFARPVNDMIMEMALMIDALKRASAKRINAVIPFYGYSRQDQKTLAREPVSAKLVADILTVAGVDRVLSVDLHTGQIQGFFDVPVDHLTAMPLLAEYVGDKYPGEMVVVSPDAGGGKLASKYSHHLGAGFAVMHKSRRADARNVSENIGLIGDVEGRRCVLVDDIIDTGGSITNAAAHLKDRGATDVIAAATHAVFSPPAIERIEESPLSEVVVTNSIPLDESQKSEKITVLSIAPIVASTIKAVFEDESVSEIFGGEHLGAIPPERELPGLG
jgi:ribose-phosphate pyrophosphokinase